jgi:hypothetical protein
MCLNQIYSLCYSFLPPSPFLNTFNRFCYSVFIHAYKVLQSYLSLLHSLFLFPSLLQMTPPYYICVSLFFFQSRLCIWERTCSRCLSHTTILFFLVSSPILSPRKPSHPVMDFFSSHLLGDSSSPGSNSTHIDIHEMIVGDRPISDENLQKMENVLDLWSSGLKVLKLFNCSLICSSVVLLLSLLFILF